MDMTDSQQIAATPEAIWTALNDPETLRQCITGCTEIEKLGDNQMRAKIALKFGPVKATFTGKVTLSDLDPPNSYTLIGEGQGGAAGFAKGQVKVSLVRSGEFITTLHYEAKVDVGGKLAQIGNRLLDSTARKFAGEFFEKFGKVFISSEAENAIVSVESVNADIDPPINKQGWLRNFVRS